MRRNVLLLMLLLAGCAAPIVSPLSPSQQAVTALELEYVQKFLVPAASYDLLPRCPQAAGGCSQTDIITKLRAAQGKLHQTIYALRDFTDASPNGDASTLIVNARASLAAAEALLPAKGGTP
jgi:hypothetical protein